MEGVCRNSGGADAAGRLWSKHVAGRQLARWRRLLPRRRGSDAVDMCSLVFWELSTTGVQSSSFDARVLVLLVNEVSSCA